MKPTDEQYQQFWEWCGWKIEQAVDKPIWQSIDPISLKPYMTTSDKECFALLFPSIDLNNLFEYAVPKLLKRELQTIAFSWRRNGECEATLWFYSGVKVSGLGMKEEDALFWAIYKVIEGE